jgi:hypothetical protein
MALSINVSPSDVATGTVAPSGTSFTTGGTGWTVNGSGSQAYNNVTPNFAPAAGNANHE